MNRRFEVFKYVVSDYLTSSLTWLLFFAFRKKVIEWPYELNVELFQDNSKFWLGIILIPVGWIVLYAVQGLYHNVFRKSRLKEFTQVFISCFLGCLVIFFLFVLDDKTNNDYTAYYKSILFLFLVQFTLNGVFRYIITTNSARKIHNRIIGFNTLIIGSNEKAEKLYQELENAKKSAGYKIIGFLHVDSGKDNYILSKYTKHLGFYEEANKIIAKNNVEEVIIALESKEHEAIQNILTNLQDSNVKVKIIPDLYNILAGQVKMNSILHAALVEITLGKLASWQLVAKRFLDIAISILVLLFGSPLYLLVSMVVKLSSKGPIFFKQERIGLQGEPFQIIKFRSMHIDAEKNGPALSKDKDSRITSVGRFLRKTRIDETPQFWNVLNGDMSIVGPRPERQFFIDQIVQKAPQYKYLHKVKPGITSWGQVKYGYAENVNEMIDRLKFDLIYMENRSMLVDFKIMIHTILVVFQGRGK
jgi:exopolysaccharide biosynthesis polyprenyl glycosylphosphotransferase